ncbi:T9SS type A sorting domain-containing protein [Mariniflexile sp. AS56]|uniref:T9SS type A sorting domain-containing protein n=1 Tax=Mariniflexile sp. AS56 TaxID=3063957 RepID=UPI0034E93DFF
MIKTENYSIYNTLGAEISKVSISENDKINIESLSNGISFLKFGNDNKIKFINNA